VRNFLDDIPGGIRAARLIQGLFQSSHEKQMRGTQVRISPGCEPLEQRVERIDSSREETCHRVARRRQGFPDIQLYIYPMEIREQRQKHIHDARNTVSQPR
jgi:hypothetical protein